MPRSRTETSKRTLARIQRLCCLGIGSEMLVPDLIREVMELIPSKGGLFFWVGEDLKIRNGYSQYPLPIRDLYFSEFYMTRRESDLILTFRELMTLPRSSPVHQFWPTLRVDHHTFLRSDFYNLIWRPVDRFEPLTLLVRNGGQSQAALYIYRGVGEQSFERSDVKMLESIAGFVAHGMTKATVGEDTFAESADRALFVADLNGTVRHAGPQAQDLLRMALNPRLLPSSNWRGVHEAAREIERLCNALAATAHGEVGQAAPVLRLRNPWGEFVLRAYWLEPTDGGEQTRHIGITIERRVPRVLALRRQVEALPLTGREKQLCLLMARDGSRETLAEAMGVSTGTVITHRSSIYAKLGVHSRAELLAALLPG